MKKSVAPAIVLSLLSIFAAQQVDAQDYVLTTRGDSLTGDVKPLFFGPQPKVQVQEENSEKVTLSLFEVRAIHYDNDIYHPVKGENGYAFMKLLEPGYLSLYAYQPENQMRFDGLFLQKKDGDNMVVPNLGFRKYMSQFLGDCPDIVARIKAGDLNKKHLAELVQAYNACVNERTAGKEAVSDDVSQRMTAWDRLEEKVQQSDISDKDDILEMITEARKKIMDRQDIPNFLVQGLKNSLKETALAADLERALDTAQEN